MASWQHFTRLEDDLVRNKIRNPLFSVLSAEDSWTPYGNPILQGVFL